MPAYYSENEPQAAAWLRQLIAKGHIAPGDVDTRSIEDVRPDDLRGYDQCHFFAGIGGWSLAARIAGIPDDYPLWTGSCPCQPFSAAGAGAGFADERHLWPAFEHLIRECRPAAVFGEQVASKVAEPWLDLVRADLEALDYAFGGLAFPAASVGAPHIRDRTYWVGYASGARGKVGVSEAEGRHQGVSGVANHTSSERVGGGRRPETAGIETIGMAHVESCRRSEERSHTGRIALRDSPQRVATGSAGGGGSRASATNGHWRDADWVACRDGKWRPVEPGTFPLAHGVPARVGRLRGYGNAINPWQAAHFLQVAFEAIREGRGRSDRVATIEDLIG